MTPEQIKLNMAVMTPIGKGVVVGWGLPDSFPYLVKIEGYSGHDGGVYPLIAGSKEALDNDGRWLSAEQLTAIEDQMTEQTHYADWEKLTPMPEGRRPDEKEGSKFVVIDDGHDLFRQGDIVELIYNDGTAIPYFKRTNKNERHTCLFRRLAPLPQPKENKMKKLVPFTDEFDWCEEGVLVMVEGVGDRYAVRAKGNKVWTGGRKPCEIDGALGLTAHSRSICQKVIQETHRQLTNREFAEFLQDHKGMVQDDNTSLIDNSLTRYYCENENKPVSDTLRFRFRGSEEWHQVTTELYEIAKELKA